jgi:hypothetical protein
MSLISLIRASIWCLVMRVLVVVAWRSSASAASRWAFASLIQVVISVRSAPASMAARYLAILRPASAIFA